MKINKVHINDFSKFHDKTFEFTDGINLIYGKNEAGKSTIHVFIKYILFGNKDARKNTGISYNTFNSSNGEDDFDGFMDIAFDDKEYRITRTFLNGNDKLEILQLNTGLNIERPEEFINELLLGLNLITFKNTISVSQLHTVTESTVAKELKNFIATMDPTEDPSLDATSAIELLEKQKLELESKISEDANQIRLLTLAEISKKEQKIVDPRYKIDINSLNNRKELVDRKLLETNSILDDTEKSIEWHKNALDSKNLKSKQDLEKIINKIEIQYSKWTSANEKLKESISLNTKIIIVTIAIFLLLVATLTCIVFYQNSQLSIALRNSLSGFFDIIDAIPLSESLLAGTCFAIGFILLILSIIFISSDINTTRIKNNSEVIIKKYYREFINTVDINKKNQKLFLDEIRKYIAYFNKLSELGYKLDETKNERNDLQEENSILQRKISNAKVILSELDQHINEINTLKEKSQNLKNTIKQNEDTTKEIESINLAIETLKDVSSEVKVSLARYLNENVSEFVKKITDNAYDSISVDDKLNIYLNTPSKLIPISSVSRGTMDQIYLALRLGAAKLIMDRSGDTLPLLFDETFTLYDDNRITKTLEFLSSRYEGQILLFTCQSREKQILDKLLIPFTYTEVL